MQWLFENRIALVGGAFIAVVVAVIVFSIYKALARWERRIRLELEESRVPVSSRHVRRWLRISNLAIVALIVPVSLLAYSGYGLLVEKVQYKWITVHVLWYFAAILALVLIASVAAWRAHILKQRAIREIRRNASLNNRRR